MNPDRLSLIFSALSSPTRRALLLALVAGPCPLGELAKPFRMTEPAVIKHLAVLERAGLVTTDRDGKVRPRTLNAEPLKMAHGWVEQFAEQWGKSFDELDTLLEKLQKMEKKSGKKNT